MGSVTLSSLSPTSAAAVLLDSGRLSWMPASLATGALAGSFLPWAYSGSRGRSLHDLATVAARLGVLHGAWGTALRAAVAVLPVVVGVAIVAAALRRLRLAGAASAVAGATVGGAGFAVLLSPLDPGPWLVASLLAGTGALAGGALACTRRRDVRSHRRLGG